LSNLIIITHVFVGFEDYGYKLYMANDRKYYIIT